MDGMAYVVFPSWDSFMAHQKLGLSRSATEIKSSKTRLYFTHIVHVGVGNFTLY